MLLGIFRPMHDSPVGDRIFLELLQKRVQMAVGVKLDLRGRNWLLPGRILTFGMLYNNLQSGMRRLALKWSPIGA